MVVKRTHREGNIAPAIKVLRAQVERAYPGRDHGSDGIFPSAAHTRRNPTSAHEAGNAIDIDNDLGNGVDVQVIYDAIKASGDPRVQRMIHNGRVWTPLRGERAYGGENPHKTHLHLEVHEKMRRDASPWSIKAAETVLCTKTHRARTSWRWTSLTVKGKPNKWEKGKRYRVTPGKTETARKLLLPDGREAWGTSAHFTD